MQLEVEAAAQWWTDRLRKAPGFQNAGVRTRDEIELSLARTIIQNESYTPLSDQSLQVFHETLAQVITQHIGSNWYPDDPLRGGMLYGRILSVDYGVSPESILGIALSVANINNNRLPTKTVMWIDPGCVSVRQGYGAGLVIIFSNTKCTSTDNSNKVPDSAS